MLFNKAPRSSSRKSVYSLIYHACYLIIFSETIKECFGMVQNTSPFNGTGHPALSINAGMSEGLPVGMMIIGKKWHEQDILNVGYAFECLRDKGVQGKQ